MIQYKIQNRSQKNYLSCVPLKPASIWRNNQLVKKWISSGLILFFLNDVPSGLLGLGGTFLILELLALEHVDKLFLSLLTAKDWHHCVLGWDSCVCHHRSQCLHHPGTLCVCNYVCWCWLISWNGWTMLTNWWCVSCLEDNLIDPDFFLLWLELRSIVEAKYVILKCIVHPIVSGVGSRFSCYVLVCDLGAEPCECAGLCILCVYCALAETVLYVKLCSIHGCFYNCRRLAHLQY